MVLLRQKKLMIIKPIYQQKSCILRKKQNQKVQKKKEEKKYIFLETSNLFDGREKVLNAFESKIFSIKSKGSGLLNTDHPKLKILTSEQMLQRLPIALAQVKAGNNSESLLNDKANCLFFVSIKKNH